MPLTPGFQLGPYEIVAPLGAGGMGEVYRARDTRLGRDVAVKVLPVHLASDPERRARLQREAKTISSLNHPNICTLFDVGRAPDTSGSGELDFLVMELVEGETLAQRIGRGPLPTSDVLRIGSQIADALERAHRAGVIHRDLKPANVMITKTGVKLMDFGLARAAVASERGSGLSGLATMSHTPTGDVPITAEGSIVGTFQYMAPEQLEGREANARSDVWALGCVLYEMVTGRRAFSGQSSASLISSIMNAAPEPMSEFAPLRPETLEKVVRQCLSRDPDDRWQNAGDVKRALEWSEVSSTPSGTMPAVPSRRRFRIVPIALGLVAGAVVAGLIAWALAPPPPDRALAVLDLPTPAGQTLELPAENVAMSPDGRWIAYVATDSDGKTRLWVRRLDSPTPRMIPDSEGPDHPFWSPDSRWIGYFTHGEVPRLMKAPVAEGTPVRLADSEWSRGAAWGSRGDILFSPTTNSPLYRVSENGGPVTQVTVFDSTRGENSHRNPSFLPDGDHFVFVSVPPTARGWSICIGSLRTRQVRKIGDAMSAATWVAPGYLVFFRDGRVVAQRLDPGRLELVGDVIPLADVKPPTSEDAARIVTGSTNGRLAFLRADVVLRVFQWRGRDGTILGQPPIPAGAYYSLTLSHDGRRAAFARSIGGFATQAMVADLASGITTGLTGTQSYNVPGCWSPDDRYVALSGIVPSGRQEIAIVPSDGSGPRRLLPTSDVQFKSPESWSPDGRTLLIDQVFPQSAVDLFIIDADSGGTPHPFVQAPRNQGFGSISPDGRWVAYSSWETGSPQIFLRRYPDGSDRTQLTKIGGTNPQWVRGGREIVFCGDDGRSLYSVPFDPAQPRAGTAARLLFRLPFPVDFGSWDVSADGERFLFLAPEDSKRPPSITVIVDWLEAARKR